MRKAPHYILSLPIPKLCIIVCASEKDAHHISANNPGQVLQMLKHPVKITSRIPTPNSTYCALLVNDDDSEECVAFKRWYRSPDAEVYVHSWYYIHSLPGRDSADIDYQSSEPSFELNRRVHLADCLESTALISETLLQERLADLGVPLHLAQRVPALLLHHHVWNLESRNQTARQIVEHVQKSYTGAS